MTERTPRNFDVCIFEGSLHECTLLTTFLENAGIASFIENENLQIGFAGKSWASPRVYVSIDDEKRTAPILKSFLKK